VVAGTDVRHLGDALPMIMHWSAISKRAPHDAVERWRQRSHRKIKATFRRD
jgi:hypothetical protein